MIDYKIEAIDEFDFPLKLKSSFAYGRFKSNFTQTMKVLERELKHLGARSGSLIIKTFHYPKDINKNGKLSADTRKPAYPGVVVWFEVWEAKAKRYVPMQFECHCYDSWKDNLRAIALSMEALRAVERHEVSSRGAKDAHTAGYKALPPSIQLGASMSVDEAAITLSRYSNGISWADIRYKKESFQKAKLVAQLKNHPDKGGKHEDMAMVNVAVGVLEGIHG